MVSKFKEIFDYFLSPKWITCFDITYKHITLSKSKHMFEYCQETHTGKYNEIISLQELIDYIPLFEQFNVYSRSPMNQALC